MKQIIQDIRAGRTIIEDVPRPMARDGQVSIATTFSLVSAGTERILLDFGKGNLIQKARQQPDKVRQALEKANTDGLLPTIESIRNKLDTPLPLGYCNVGVVVESKVEGLRPGCRVVSNGRHAEYVCVPKNLCANIPDSVDDESAAFTVIGSIALQGIRLIEPTLGETVVVTGLGLIGLVAVQLLRASGCRVIGLDFDFERLALARQFGAYAIDLGADEDPIAVTQRLTRDRGVDAVLITASTKSNEPIHQAATMCRKRGRIVLVGVVGMEISRADFYQKELSFRVSCSYGPGRYDPNYEEKGQDYPVGYVRWTEQRNFEAVLDMMADGRLDMTPLITHRFSIDDAAAAYEVVSHENPLGVLLHYPEREPNHAEQTVQLREAVAPVAAGKAVIGFIGAGNYASAVLVPAFAQTDARLKTISSATGVNSVYVGKKHGIERATTDTEKLLTDDEINALVVTTRHNSHAHWVLKALQCGRHVFVEKPLALTNDELDCIAESYAACRRQPILMVGFNRRYSPLIRKIRSLLSTKSGPIAMQMTVNAGSIPSDHWTQDRAVGGGRIIGEACHFVDLLRCLAGSQITDAHAKALDTSTRDSVMIQLAFANGSVGTISYLANGSKAFPKERLEVFTNGGILQLDNFRVLRGFGWPGFKSKRLIRQDKGQRACTAAFVNAIQRGNRESLIPFGELIEVSRVSIDVDSQVS